MIYNRMLDAFENEIDNEVDRITNILIDKARNKEIVNMGFDQLVDSLLDKKYDFFSLVIKTKVHSNIPDYYGTDIDGIYALIPSHLSLEKTVLKYVKDKKESDGNDFKKVAEKFAEYLIDNKILNFELASTIDEFKRKNYIAYFDSYAYMATSYFLEDALRERGYIVEAYGTMIKIRKIRKI